MMLAGLIFVGISMNLQKLLEKRMVSRAAWVCFLSLVEVLLVSSFMLIPEQSFFVVGIEVGVIRLICWIIITGMTFSQLARFRPDGFVEGQSWYGKLAIVMLSQLITLPFVIAGVMLLVDMASRVYWIVPGVYLL